MWFELSTRCDWTIEEVWQRFWWVEMGEGS